MKRIFVNLKRFDVPENYGGICPMGQSDQWIEWVIEESTKNGLGQLDGMEVIYILPESLLIPAINKLNTYTVEQQKGIGVASQYVYREDIAVNGNFGAFSANLPASAVCNMGCEWAMIGHSEERKDKIGLMSKVSDDQEAVKRAVDEVLNEEVHRAAERQLNVLLCVGETAQEKGTGPDLEQKARVEAVLKAQLLTGLNGFERYTGSVELTIGYEPMWAIGPGKTPPDQPYIAFVSAYIKEVLMDILGQDIAVVYGGGLKEANAEEIAGIDTIDGGLVALTTFTVPPKFEPEALKNIISIYKKI